MQTTLSSHRKFPSNNLLTLTQNTQKVEENRISIVGKSFKKSRSGDKAGQKIKIRIALSLGQIFRESQKVWNAWNANDRRSASNYRWAGITLKSIS